MWRIPAQKVKVSTRSGSRSVWVMAEMCMDGQSALLTADRGRSFEWAWYFPHSGYLKLSDKHHCPKFIQAAFQAFVEQV